MLKEYIIINQALGEKEVFDIFKTYYDEDGDNDIE